MPSFPYIFKRNVKEVLFYDIIVKFGIFQVIATGWDKVGMIGAEWFKCPFIKPASVSQCYLKTAARYVAPQAIMST